jgi:ATP-dependent Clp protease ATP-binding subunit ClpC
VFERFTERARQSVVLAQDEARALKHNYIGTEHLLLGLLREGEGIPLRVFEAFGITVEEMRMQVARIVGQGDEITTGQIPFTPRAKKVLELSLREALGLGHDYIGTEHVLLGLLREGEGVAVQILRDFADPEEIKQEVIDVLSGRSGGSVIGLSYVPKSPPLAAEVLAEIQRVRTQREEAVETHEFERAARLRERERRLSLAARELERAWTGEPPTAPGFHPQYQGGELRPQAPWRRPRRFSAYGSSVPATAVIVGWLLFAVSLGIGLLIGWLIWG